MDLIPRFTILALVSGFVMTSGIGAAGDSLSAEQIAFFESNIRPVLVEKCFKCHSQSSEKIKGGLILDTRESTLKGGDSGAAVTPGSLDESLLYTAITYQDADLQMPPKSKLPDEIVGKFKEWIEMGAPDPRTGDIKIAASPAMNLEKGRQHWAYQAPVAQPPPAVGDAAWAKTDLDRFILAKLETAGMKPSGDANARDVLRRLSFDLIGLPPTPLQLEDFLTAWARDPETALAGMVDTFLASPQFGERWGRHWLDAARYGESSGKEVNVLYPYAYRYRDYVIDSFNNDKPYNAFIQEQIAGDLMPADSDKKRAEKMVATGFLAIGPKSLNEQNTRQFRFDVVDEQIDAVTRAVMATTVSCARCHDHKFDPISQKDYYALAGIFLSSETCYGTVDSVQTRRGSPLVELPLAEAGPGAKAYSPGELIEMQFRLGQLQEQYAKTLEEVREERRQGTANDATNFLKVRGLQSQINLLETKLQSVNADGVPRPFAMGVRDRDESFDAQLLIRGDDENTGDRIPRGFPAVFTHGPSYTPSPAESGRLDLAKWLTSEDNPLTARVLVNRLWYELFGRGIVSSLDNFGTTGDHPSHPELLDYLSLRLIANHWSIKQTLREICLSRTYRMSSAFDAESFAKDPENLLHWRANPRRLDAESLRDSMLAVSGQLDLKRPEGSPVAEAGDGTVGRGIREDFKNVTEDKHRSVYLPIIRDQLPDALGLFDFADPSLVAGARDVTTVPSQALYLMNHPFVQKAASEMGARILAVPGLDKNQRAAYAFTLAYSRPPTDEELRKTGAFLSRFLETARTEEPDPKKAGATALASFCQSLLASAEFRYLD